MNGGFGAHGKPSCWVYEGSGVSPLVGVASTFAGRWQLSGFLCELVRAVRRVMQVVAWWICHQRKRGTQAVNVYECIRIPAHPWFNSFLNQKLSPVFLSFPLLFLLINVFLSLSPTPQVNGFWFSRSLIIYKLLSYAFRINIKSLKNIHNSHSTLILGIIIRK